MDNQQPRRDAQDKARKARRAPDTPISHLFQDAFNLSHSVKEYADETVRDFQKYGPSMLNGAIKEVKEHPQDVALAAAGGALVAVGVCAESPIIIGGASAVGLMCIGGAILDATVSHVPPNKYSRRL